MTCSSVPASVLQTMSSRVVGDCRCRQVAAGYRVKAGWLVPTRVGNGASLGARCVILPGAHIGAYAMVAAGAVVTREVPAHALVAGVPAKPVGWVCRCGARLVEERPASWRCPQCGEAYDEHEADGQSSLAEVLLIVRSFAGKSSMFFASLLTDHADHASKEGEKEEGG